jgi:hypothetical protein
MPASSTLHACWVVLALTSCGSSQLPLTPAEEARLQALSTRLGREVSLQYDRDAVTHHRANGTLVIAVSQTVTHARDASFCGADSLALQQQAAAIATELVPTMRFARNHNYITFIYSTEHILNNRSSNELCSRVLEGSLRTKSLVFRNNHFFRTTKNVFGNRVSQKKTSQ